MPFGKLQADYAKQPKMYDPNVVVKVVKLEGVKVGRRGVYVDSGQYLRVGAASDALTPAEVFGQMTRSETRTFRKKLREAGFARLAAQARRLKLPS